MIWKVKYPRKNSMRMLRVICSRQLCESEVKKEVLSFELEWWTTHKYVSTHNFDLLYLYYYYQFSGG